MNRQRATMSDVAMHAGVSIATVSRALNGSRRMSPELAEKVMQSAEALGYQINLLGRALRTQRTGTVGLLVPDLTNPYFTQLAEALSRHVSSGGMELLVASSRGSTNVEARLIETLIGQQVEALLIIPCDEDKSAEHIFETAGQVPTIQIDRRADRRATHYVGTDDNLGFELISEHITQVNGAAQLPVTFIGADLHVPSAQGRLEAFCQHFGQTTTYLGDYSFKWGAEACQRILESGVTSGIIVAAADIIAFGAINVLARNKYEIPRDFRIIGYDGVLSDFGLHPSLTTVAQPVEAIAQQTWEVLWESLEHPTSAREIRIAPTLKLGSSSPTPNH